MNDIDNVEQAKIQGDYTWLAKNLYSRLDESDKVSTINFMRFKLQADKYKKNRGNVVRFCKA